MWKLKKMDDAEVSDHDHFKSASESSDEENSSLSPSDRLLTAARNGDKETIKDLTAKHKQGEITLDLNCKGEWNINLVIGDTPNVYTFLWEWSIRQRT